MMVRYPSVELLVLVPVGDILAHHGGSVLSALGDGVKAIFGKFGAMLLHAGMAFFIIAKHLCT
jgi:class 3 adenylate cyclase